MISILITILIACIIFGLIWYLVGMLPLPAPFGQIVRVIVIVIGILYLLGMLTGVGGLAPLRIG